MKLTARLHWPALMLLVLGVALLGRWAGGEAASLGFQVAASSQLDAARAAGGSGHVRHRTSDAAAPRAPGSVSPLAILEPGVVLGRLEIPRLRLRAIVAEGVDKKTLGRAVGHVPSTALPGSPGNCALAGHRDSFLRGLGGVRVNDVIRIVTREGTYLYQVEWSAVVDPHRVDVLDATAGRSLTLITCFPFEYIGHAPQRFIVRASQTEAVAGP